MPSNTDNPIGKYTVDTNSSHHLHTLHPNNDLQLTNSMRKELTKAIAKKDAIKIDAKASLAEIAKLFDMRIIEENSS